jgi:hypothetical protein
MDGFFGFATGQMRNLIFHKAITDREYPSTFFMDAILLKISIL